MAQLDDATLAAAVLRRAVYARMDPAQKIRIVRRCRPTASSSR
jgi:magnesium-transporting ATPase (P-type)